MRPIVLDSSQSLTDLVNSQNNGLGVLEPTACTVTEERNGIYDLSMTLPITSPHYSDLANGSLIRVTVADGTSQIFRVYRMQKMMSGLVEVDAHHIAYDLAKAPVIPFTATGASAAVSGLKSHLMTAYPFTITTDITNTSSTFTLGIPRTFRECLGGYSGSILDVFGGVYEWDNLTVRLLANRGSDKGVRIAYGKNLTDLNQEANIEAVYDAVVGYAQIDEVTYYGGIVYANQKAQPKVKIVDFSSEFESDVTPTAVQLNQLAQAYIDNNDIGTPKVSIDVEFAPLWKSPEYKNIAPLEQVDIDDTVHVYYEKLGVEASAKVIRTVWNVLLERFDEVSLGDARTTLSESIVSEADEATAEATGFLDSYINGLTQIIANGLGLFTTRAPDANGGTKLYLHNRPTLAESRYQWTINSGGFAVSQDYGQTWTAGIDSDGNAVFNSLAANEINALTINGSTINGSVVVFDPNGQSVTARGSNLGEDNGVIFTGAGDFTVETQTIGLTGTGDSSGQGVQILNKENGTTRGLIKLDADKLGVTYTGASAQGSITFSDDELSIAFVGASKTIQIALSNEKGLAVYFDGTGWSGLGFVNDGNGHWVIGR